MNQAPTDVSSIKVRIVNVLILVMPTSHRNRNCVKDGGLIFGSPKERAATGACIAPGESTLLMRVNGRALDDIRESIKGESAFLFQSS